MVYRFLTALLSGLMVLSAVQAADNDELFAPPNRDQVREKVLKWRTDSGVKDPAAIKSIEQLWATTDESISAVDLHELAIRSFAVGNVKVEQLAEKCRFGSNVVPATDTLDDSQLGDFAGSNLRAHVGRFLAQAEFFDEALTVFAAVKPDQLIDPASYFFHRAVCEHRLLMKDEGLESLKSLQENTADVPVRYSNVAKLMQSDLERLKEKSLDEVSRMMSDVERRLNLGRGGAKVQKVEEEIVSRLDELIKKLEAQQQAAQQSQQGGKGGDGNPLPDSIIKGSTAPGEVDKRDIGNKSGWGALPPKQQTRAKNLIDRELPPHYRNAIEQYLRKLATRPESRGR